MEFVTFKHNGLTTAEAQMLLCYAAKRVDGLSDEEANKFANQAEAWMQAWMKAKEEGYTFEEVLIDFFDRDAAWAAEVASTIQSFRDGYETGMLLATQRISTEILEVGVQGFMQRAVDAMSGQGEGLLKPHGLHNHPAADEDGYEYAIFSEDLDPDNPEDLDEDGEVLGAYGPRQMIMKAVQGHNRECESGCTLYVARRKAGEKAWDRIELDPEPAAPGHYL